MSSRDFEEHLEELLSQDLSAGIEVFRDELLERCLEAFDTGSKGIVLDDSIIDSISAAGDIASLYPDPNYTK